MGPHEDSYRTIVYFYFESNQFDYTYVNSINLVLAMLNATRVQETMRGYFQSAFPVHSYSIKSCEKVCGEKII